MKKFFLPFVSLLCCVAACDKASSSAIIDEQKEIIVNDEVQLFYSNLADIIKATTSFQIYTKSQAESEHENPAEYYLEHDLEYPLFAKLATIEILTESGEGITFFDLMPDEQALFIEEYTKYEAAQLSQKIEQIPILEQYVAAQNEVISEVIDDLSIDTKAGGLTIDDSKAFLSSLSKKIAAKTSNFTYNDNSISTKGSGKNGDDNALAFDYVLSLIAGKAKRGDIIMALPCHGNPYCQVTLGNTSYKVGHAEIFTQNINTTTKQTDYVLLGAWTQDGVSKQSLSNWCCKSYVLGVCSYKAKWVWKGLNAYLKTTQTPVDNPGELATWAEKYIGCDYVKWYEFLTAKWAAPKRYTCTSLVWWCAKNAYSERISPWLTALVSPSDVLLDNNTYVKVVIE